MEYSFLRPIDPITLLYVNKKENDEVNKIWITQHKPN
jgi:hypothetical protein